METAKIYTLTKEEFLHNRKTWTKYIKDKHLGSASNHLLVALMYGTDPFKAFSPYRSEEKLAKFNHWESLDSAAYSIFNELTYAKACLDGTKKPYDKYDPKKYRIVRGYSGKDDIFFHLSASMIEEFIPILEATRQRIKEHNAGTSLIVVE